MDVFFELSIVIVFATLVAGVMRLLKQPIIIGYILAGLLLGPQFLNIFHSVEEISVFSEMGIAILLFIVGLHLSPKEITGFGKTAFLIGFLQVLVTASLVFLISLGFKFSTVEALYLGVALSFSSTIIVLKILSDKKDLEKLHGKISVGVLLIQDIIAALALIFATTIGSGAGGVTPFILLVMKGLAFTLGVTLISVYVLPALSTFFARSQEYLFLFSLAWGLGLASLAHTLGFSIEIGALIAGVSLSVSPYSAEISAKLKPLRDFFVVLFFVLLGSRVTFNNFSNFVVPFVVFLSFILLLKPLIIMSFTSFFRYNRKTSFFSSISLAQISEFSMILALLGLKLGHIQEDVLSLITMLGVVSIAVSTYLMTHIEKFYPKLSTALKFFERSKTIGDVENKGSYEIVLFGCNRSGYDFIKIFKTLGDDFLAVDFDPDIIEELPKRGVNCLYGDAEDGDFLEDINITEARMVISTIPDYEISSFLLSKIRSANENSIVILLSNNIDEALRLYEQDATYVILPHFIGGNYTVNLASEAGFNLGKLNEKRKEHVDYLLERKSLGHSHPTWTRY